MNKELKYIKTGFGIEVDLHYKDYIARANVLKAGNDKPNTYDVTLELRRSDIGKWDTLDDKHYSIVSENINMATYEFIMDKFAEGFFKYFIDRYEYDLKCYDKGDEFFEQERLGE